MPSFFRLFSILVSSLAIFPSCLMAGGPRLVAGAAYFNPGVMGTPIHWANGQVSYFVDQGPLSPMVTNEQAVAMVDAAAALWNAVPTAGVRLVDQGSLNEDVNGSNAVAGNGNLASPGDVSASAANYPVAVIFDYDGSVIDSIFGAENSDPSSCETNAVTVWTDNINPDATLVHAILLVNGRCTDTANRLEMMSFLLERGFGMVLGLGFAQVDPDALNDMDFDGAESWPVMQPRSGSCGPAGGRCIANLYALSLDDVAELNRLYPITSANLAAFPGKMLAAPNTVSITGTITFRAGTGMQGVNVVAVPLDAGGNPLEDYTITAVSGALFSGNHGSVVTGWTAQDGTPLAQYGSTDPSVQGAFDLSYMPLPPGVTSAAYQLTFEPINPLFIYQNVVGPYQDGSPLPSGTLAPITTPVIAAGGSQQVAVNVSDTATGDYDDAIATEAAPRLLPSSGLWSGRLNQVGQTDWFNFPIRGNRTFTVVTQAVNELGAPSGFKAMPAIGIWDAFAPIGTPSVGTAPGLNGTAIGETWLRVNSSSDDVVRLGIADMRGDGRPDYAYNAWVLYADTVQPQRIPSSGGPIVIHGMGFRVADTVLVNGKSAVVTSISPNEITAIAPASGGVTGSVDVEVDDVPIFYAAAIVSGGVTYDAGTGDSLTVMNAPANTVPEGVPLPFTVAAVGADLTPAAGVTVIYSVSSGTAVLGCGKSACPVVAAGDGTASMNVTATDGTASVVVAKLCNGASLQAHFSGGTPPSLAALTPSLSVAAGSAVTWITQAMVLSNGKPAIGQTVQWHSGNGIAVGASASVQSGAGGIASQALAVGPLSEGQQATAAACLNGTTQCVNFSALGARPEYAYVEAVSGTSQSTAIAGTPSVITLRVRDMDGNPMAGGIVTLYQAVYAWEPPCPPHGRCSQAQLLGANTATATSAVDGTVTFNPAIIPGVATNTIGLAATGNASTVSTAVEMHP